MSAATEERAFTCIVCPEGCAITAVSGPEGVTVSGNKCPRGAAYVRQELTDPRRNISSTAAVEGGTRPVVPVKTASPVPKGRIFAVMDEIRRLRVTAPVQAGQVLIEDAAGTGCAVAATGSVEKAE